jgi:hypothetical protein
MEGWPAEETHQESEANDTVFIPQCTEVDFSYVWELDVVLKES